MRIFQLPASPIEAFDVIAGSAGVRAGDGSRGHVEAGTLVEDGPRQPGRPTTDQDSGLTTNTTTTRDSNLRTIDDPTRRNAVTYTTSTSR